MELKSYQQNVIDDLERYLALLNQGYSASKAFSEFWLSHSQYALTTPECYHDKLSGVPNICLKVPTAGGKTFIAVNALKPIFNAKSYWGNQSPNMVLWLVPSESILSQTLKNLKETSHPYRQKLNVHFGGKVTILDKEQVLRGNEFDADSVKLGVSVLVMTFDSLKGRSKETLRAFRENPNLASFDELPSVDNLAEFDESSLINVLRKLKPVIIVDESHNATSPLSQEMLANLNPSFVLELTATPKENSNIISYVGATELKQHQMVKLPLIISKQRNQNEVMMAALTLRNNLEKIAQFAQTQGAPYVRPIVLFQAEPRSTEDKTTFDKVKQALLDIGIPEKHIAIKTSDINELKNVDLLSPDCEIRYVITVNALKEGWDCSFAYILASLANKSSVVDVTQIVGRVLRQPYARDHKSPELNLSYVFTSSDDFDATLQNVATGLNAAGFSKQDYRLAEQVENGTLDESTQQTPTQTALNLTSNNISETLNYDDDYSLDLTTYHFSQEETANVTGINEQSAVQNPQNSVTKQIANLQQQAVNYGKEFAKQVEQAVNQGEAPSELQGKTNMQKMRTEFVEQMTDFELPQFIVPAFDNALFVAEDEKILLDKNHLLRDFKLSHQNSDISFEQIQIEISQSEIDDKGNVHFSPLKGGQKQALIDLFSSHSTKSQQDTLIKNLTQMAGKKAFYPIDDKDIYAYIRRIVETMTEQQRKSCFENTAQYFGIIKQKIDGLSRYFAEQEFFKQLDSNDIELAEDKYAFPVSITPTKLSTPLARSLYEREGEMNMLESTVLHSILNHEDINLKWWHRNIERKGFYINAFINHYPDFIFLTEKDTVVLLETKGNDRDNSDSESKIRAGKAWENAANTLGDGRKYRYMMVFETNKLDGAYSVADMLNILKKL
ncbi:DEAD/DEAH box helicase [Pasteurella multocida]